MSLYLLDIFPEKGIIQIISGYVFGDETQNRCIAQIKNMNYQLEYNSTKSFNYTRNTEYIIYNNCKKYLYISDNRYLKSIISDISFTKYVTIRNDIRIIGTPYPYKKIRIIRL
jgi:hypothetical protein